MTKEKEEIEQAGWDHANSLTVLKKQDISDFVATFRLRAKSSFVDGAQWQSQHHAARVEKLEAALTEIIKEVSKKYNAECDEVDWYNNNMPCVGQGLDYKARPSRPAVLLIATDALREEGEK